MLRRHLLICLLLLLVLLAAPTAAQALSESALRTAIATQMRAAGGASSAYVMETDSDRPLYALRADRPLILASVNKLFVTATTLRRYGPDATFDTSVLATGEVGPDGVLDGDLYLRGAGDPTLNPVRIAALAAQLEDIRRVRGRVYGDESRFDDLRGSYNTGGRLDWEIGGQLGALVSGRGYAGGGWQQRPAAVAADQLRRALIKAGVKVTGAVGVRTTPADALELATSSSVPVAQLIALTNVPSDNYYAETLLKDLGASFGAGGTTASGARVVRREMATLDVRPAIYDGSGLSRRDRAGTRQVVTLIDHMAEGDHGAAFLDSLAVAGRSGTLRNRMRSSAARTRCRGKTGTLRDVSNLAGVCTTAGGEQVAFALLMNGVNPTSAHRLQDRILSAIARLR